MIRALTALSLFALIGCTSAAERPQRPATSGVVEAIALVKADKIDVNLDKWNEPACIATEAELKKLIPDEATQKRLMKEVDFKTHVLLVFSWEGSGADKFGYVILESFPEQVNFSLKSGVQLDHQSHLKLFAVKKECTWSAK